MMVNVQKRNGDVVTMVPQKMILYSIYQKAEETIAERNQAITILTNKVNELLFLKYKIYSTFVLDTTSRKAFRATNESYIGFNMPINKKFSQWYTIEPRRS